MPVVGVVAIVAAIGTWGAVGVGALAGVVAFGPVLGLMGRHGMVLDGMVPGCDTPP